MSRAASLAAPETRPVVVRLCSSRDMDPARWEAFVADCPDATYFHTPEWMSLLTRSFPRWHGRVLVAEQPAGRWLALFPYVHVARRGVHTFLSMPLGTFGGPLAAEGCPQGIVANLCDRLVAEIPNWHCRGILIAEYGNGALRSLPAEILRRYRLVQRTTHVLDLTGGAETVWKTRYERQRRRQARHARRLGLTVRRTERPEDYRDYFSLYQEVSRNWRSRMRLPGRFFENLAEARSTHLQLWVAEVDGRMVAGNLSVLFRDTVISICGCMRRDFISYCPAVALHHATIEEACRRGCRTYHLGPSLDLPSVARFKEQFGSEPRRCGLYFALTPFGRILERLRPAILRACHEEGEPLR